MTKQIYSPSFGPQVAAQIESGRRQNTEASLFFNAMEIGYIDDWAPDKRLRYVLDMIACGMASKCWLSVAEAVAALQDLEAQMRTP